MTIKEVLLILVVSLDSVISQVMSQKHMRQIVDGHNKYRRRDVELNKANDMQKMEWNETLAEHAAHWVNQCIFEHRNSGHYEGENLYYNTAEIGDPSLINKGLDSWYEEISDFNYDTLGCVPNKMCGHYTQMVWGTTKQVGCSVKRCAGLRDAPRIVPNAWYLACFYYPPGNFRGQKPYAKGPTCQSCDPGQKCDRGLCTDGIVRQPTTGNTGGLPTTGNTNGQPSSGTTVGQPSSGEGQIIVHVVGLPDSTNQGHTGESCSDESKYCNMLSHLCKNVNFKPRMEQFCRKTCGFCKTVKKDSCRDAIDCGFLKMQKNICDIAAMKPSLEKNCKKSCGFCNSGGSRTVTHTGPSSTPSGTSNNVCIDIEKEKCSTNRWQSFCKSKEKGAFMKQNCAKTCGFCQAPTSPQLADLILDTHNNHRRNQRASDMNMLRWNKTLADKATEWVSSCTFPNNGRQSLRGLGQNLAFHTKRTDDRDMINTILDSWYKEVSKYDFMTKDCRRSGACHYTQMVWASTTEIGCAFRRCSELKWYKKPIEHAWYITCFYSPPGNRYNMMTGEFDAPFKRGRACSRCKAGQICNNGLCS